MKLSSTLLVLSFCFCVAANAGMAQAQGNHVGEQKQIDVSIEFLNPAGQTITNEHGIDFLFWGLSFHEDTVYPSQYWGTYPMYFYWSQATVIVRVTNVGPRNMEKIRVTTDARIIKGDGSFGGAITSDQQYDLELRRGETKVIDASFVAIPPFVGASGLDRYMVTVGHINPVTDNEGKGPAVIMRKTAVFCPPDYRPEP